MTTRDSLLTERALKEWTGYRRRSDLEAWLRAHRVPFAYGAGGCLITTEPALTAALGQPRPTVAPAVPVGVDFA